MASTAMSPSSLTSRLSSPLLLFLLSAFLLLSCPGSVDAADANCSAAGDQCQEGVVLPVWNPQNPSVGDKVARAIVYFVALIYMFLGMSIIADRFMSSIEVITSQEKEITIKRSNGETTTATVRIWNETVSNLTLMALGSSAPEILLSVIEVCGHDFEAGSLGPSTIVGSAAFNMFVIIALCVYVVPDGETRKIKHLRVFFVTAAWSIFAYIWLYLILSVFSPGEVEVWEAVLTFLFFPLCVGQAWVADRRLLFYKYVRKRYRADKRHGIIIETEGGPDGAMGMSGVGSLGPGGFTKMDMLELDGQMALNSHSGMDGGMMEDGAKDGQDEARRDMAKTLKDLKQRHPDKDMEQLIEMANYQVLMQQQKSRAFYRIQATRMMIGAGNILKKHAADQARKVVSSNETQAQEDDPHTITMDFEPALYQCFENCGSLKLTVGRHGGDPGVTVKVDYRTEDGTANAGSDYEFAEGTLLFKPGETLKEITVGVIDDDIFEEDEYFYVHLSNPRMVGYPEIGTAPQDASVAPKAVLGDNHSATVTIYDDDHAGIFTFEAGSQKVSESVGVMELKVLRTSGARGLVAVPYRTVDGSARAGEDYEVSAGKLEFQNDETMKIIEVKIIDDELYEKNKTFTLELGEPILLEIGQKHGDSNENKPLVGAEDEEVAKMGCPSLGEHTQVEVVIEESYEFKRAVHILLWRAEQNTVDKLIKKTNLALVVGSSSWREQFVNAVTVSAGDDDEEESGEERLPSCFDYIMHFLTVFWKVLFAFVPPTEYWNGWACFIVSISLIGVLTAVTGDLASHFGCTVGLKDSVTAVVFVALGTSVPDTFASKVAAIQDQYADASIGNVTGSNAVNVFLGIGVAWTLAAVVWRSRGKVFRVDPGNLAFSVTLYTIMAVICMLILLYRRRASVAGGELGGPRTCKIITSLLFFSMWLIYILLASLEAYCHLPVF
ncbi:solute carrier family 8 member 4b isoform X1 [Pseudochaenichthys georgianus]|uniref:solute carrier family 8 member 4b isoform X1 n=1 Tax=Pseudochaenichthys georgianus TaxID=52239 RepID=UPI00146B772D|nr:solute carrier family 8 member 4b isoform X1 [Pseudochaenichthys georgianus]XP_033962383.1 solute carrier family 8 member 4b isoform X1 [Pseudochaenichthys georgianus]XP_033962384.1 solute carrier family 8 member 4b isoform X1 [Pseudochaenichthys georgianus]